jgi:hypothetical protein
VAETTVIPRNAPVPVSAFGLATRVHFAPFQKRGE